MNLVAHLIGGAVAATVALNYPIEGAAGVGIWVAVYAAVVAALTAYRLRRK